MDPEDAFLDTFRARIEREIEEHGLALQSVLSRPGVTHTMGLSDRGHPELLLVGFTPVEASSLLLEAMQRGVLEALSDGAEELQLDGVRVRLERRSMNEVGRLVNLARILARRRGRTVQCVQLLYPDAEDRFPGSPGCDPACTRLQDPSGVVFDVAGE
jgi:hypothetical protein